MSPNAINIFYVNYLRVNYPYLHNAYSITICKAQITLNFNWFLVTKPLYTYVQHYNIQHHVPHFKYSVCICM